ncbi:AraC family transcriptional regulator [Saccharicrinis aurantiacus]|uniref:AraC family transcriptional regulator n=1 Tax=Saccharicrinis aurantiacus TaxID=1849719 RepID=UPI0008388629|nr:AraC family transcriptional regulator [Saccharicrinis aurantiacus]
MRATLKPVIKSANQSILVKNDQLKTFYAPHHFHPEYEIIYIKKSYGTKIIGNYVDNYQTGELVILGPGLPHFHVVGNGQDNEEYPIETIAVLFPASIFENSISFPEFNMAFHLLEQMKYGLELFDHTKKEVVKVLESMTLEPSIGNYVALFKIIEIISLPNSSYQKLSSVKFDNKKLYNDKTAIVLNFLANNYLNSIAIDDVAKEVDMSKSAFCNFFKTQTGHTFSHYINMLRISKACELLATTPKSISEIAFEIGFENLAYFNRRFKEIKKLTPKEFRLKIEVA